LLSGGPDRALAGAKAADGRGVAGLASAVLSSDRYKDVNPVAEELGQTARSAIEALKGSPWLLGLIVINGIFLAAVFYGARDTRMRQNDVIVKLIDVEKDTAIDKYATARNAESIEFIKKEIDRLNDRQNRLTEAIDSTYNQLQEHLRTPHK